MPTNNRTTTGRTAIGQFAPGNQLCGGARGSRHRNNTAIETLIDGDAERLTQRVIQLAMEGDSTAMKIVFDRICPPPKSRPVNVDLPPVDSAHDIMAAQAAVVAAAADGTLSLDEAATLSAMLDKQRAAMETHDLSVRLDAIEQGFDA